MAVSLYSSATEYMFNQITFARGSVADVLTVGVYYGENPNEVPDVEDFTTVTLVDGVANPEDPLAETGKIDIAALIGPRNGDVALEPGNYQVWVCISTATEDVVRRVDTLTVT